MQVLRAPPGLEDLRELRRSPASVSPFCLSFGSEWERACVRADAPGLWTDCGAWVPEAVGPGREGPLSGGTAGARQAGLIKGQSGEGGVVSPLRVRPSVWPYLRGSRAPRSASVGEAGVPRLGAQSRVVSVLEAVLSGEPGTPSSRPSSASTHAAPGALSRGPPPPRPSLMPGAPSPGPLAKPLVAAAVGWLSHRWAASASSPCTRPAPAGLTAPVAAAVPTGPRMALQTHTRAAVPADASTWRPVLAPMSFPTPPRSADPCTEQGHRAG